MIILFIITKSLYFFKSIQLIDILDQAILLSLGNMQVNTISQKKASQISRKSTQSPRLQQQNEHDHRQYRYILSLFAQNVNLMFKRNRDCLGQMQYHPKYNVSKEQKQGYQLSLIEIYQKYRVKIMRESIYRNTIIRKSCENYINQYHQVYPQSKESSSLSNKNHDSSIPYIKKISINDKKLYSFSIKSHVRKTTPSVSNQERLLVISQTFQAFQANLSALRQKTKSSDSQEAKDYFLKTTNSTNPKRQKLRLKSDQVFISQRHKSLFERQKATEKYKNITFRGSSMIISKNQKTQRGQKQWECQKQFPIHNRFCTKRVVAIGHSQKKAINDIQLLHLQTKNILFENSFLPSNERGNYRASKIKKVSQRQY